MMTRNRARAFASGVLVANALPHAYAAAVGATQLTPLRGRDSGPRVNALWSASNIALAYALSRGLRSASVADRVCFKAGVAGFSTWSLVSEWVTDFT